MTTGDLNGLRRRIAELERKEQARARREHKANERLKKFIDIARQAVMLLLGAIEDWGNIVRTIPSRKDRRK